MTIDIENATTPLTAQSMPFPGAPESAARGSAATRVVVAWGAAQGRILLHPEATPADAALARHLQRAFVLRGERGYEICRADLPALRPPGGGACGVEIPGGPDGGAARWLAEALASFGSEAAPEATMEPPEPATERAPAVDDGDEPDWYTPAVLALEARERPRALWAADHQSADYRHLDAPFASAAFDLSHDVLAALCARNDFAPRDHAGAVWFALRGCRRVDDGRPDLHDTIRLVEAVPDHRTFQCVVGVWRRDLKQLAVSKGSTVPNEFNMKRQLGAAGRAANILPTGCYEYTVGRHDDSVLGALRLEHRVIVLRSKTDLMYTHEDVWDVCKPHDNVHPAFRGEDDAIQFSSAGCLTIPGAVENKRRHLGNWADLREHAHLARVFKSAEAGRRYGLVLLTGRDARLTATGAPPRRLRFGAEGAPVMALQDALRAKAHYGGATSGRFDAATAAALVAWQRAAGRPTDAIVTPADATALGFSLV